MTAVAGLPRLELEADSGETLAEGIARFSSEEQAVRTANDTPYGIEEWLEIKYLCMGGVGPA